MKRLTSTSPETPIDRQRLVDQIILHEGYKRQVYYDTQGHPTVGVGFNLDRPDASTLLGLVGAPSLESVLEGMILSDEEILKLLSITLNEAIHIAEALVKNFWSLDDVRKRVVIDLAFNLGETKFRKFRNTIKAIEEERFEDAARGLESSLWYSQVKTRGVRLVRMMRTGEDYIV